MNMYMQSSQHSSLILLPFDIMRAVLADWTNHDVITVSKIDVAFCDQCAREHFVSSVQGLLVTMGNSEVFTSSKLSSSSKIRFVQWIASRRLRLQDICLNLNMTSQNGLQFLEGLVAGSPTFLTEITKIVFVGSNPCLASSIIGILNSSVKLAKLECAKQTGSNVDGWKYLPAKSNISSIYLSGSLSELDVSSPNLELWSQNLRSITLKSDSVVAVSIIALVTYFKKLKQLSIESSRISAKALPRPEQWDRCPKLPHLRLLRITGCSNESSDPCLTGYLINRCDNLVNLFISHLDLCTAPLCAGHLYLNLIHRLKQFEFNIAGTVYFSTLRRAPSENLVNIEQSQALPAVTLLKTLQDSGRTRCFRASMASCAWSTLPTIAPHFWTALTELTFVRVNFETATTTDWYEILASTTIRKLQIKLCAGVATFVEAVKWCFGTSTVSQVVDLDIQHNRSDCPDINILATVLDRVFPSLQSLVLVFPGFTDTDLLCLTRTAQKLRSISVGDSDGKEQFALKMISSAAWLHLVCNSECKRWTLLNMRVVAWKYIQRMVEYCGSHLKRLTIHPHGSAWKAKLEHPSTIAFMSKHPNIVFAHSASG